MPDVPPLAKTYPGYAIASWYGVVAPTNTPKAIQDTLSKALAKSMSDPNLVPKMATLGVEPAVMDAAQFSPYIDQEIKSWAEMIKIAKIPKQ
ncbi:Tripartite tricarboxylate transporter family receptor [compost metagenome]